MAQDIINQDGVLPDIIGLGAIDAGAAASEVFSHLPLNLGDDYAPWAGSLLFPFLEVDNFFDNLILTGQQVEATLPNVEGERITKTIKFNEGTYDLIALLQAARDAATSASGANRFDSFLQFIDPDVLKEDHPELISRTNAFFASYYNLEEGEFDVGNDLPFNKWNSLGNWFTGGDIDYVVGSYGNDFLSHSTADKRIVMNGGRGNDTLIGSANSDLIDGSVGDDTLYGGAGNDFLYGGAGVDYLYGEDGNDYLYGGSEHDELHGGTGNDHLYGEGGADTLIGGEGRDSLYGGDGIDTIRGGTGDDYIEGGLEADRIEGGEGRDVLYGGGGADTLIGGLGHDVILGGEGNDTYIFKPGDGHDIILDTSGTNTLIIDDRTISELINSGEGDNIYKNAIDESDTHRYIKTDVGLTIVAENGIDIIQIISWIGFENFGITTTTEEDVYEPNPDLTDIVIGDGHDVAVPGTENVLPDWQPTWGSYSGYEGSIIYEASLFDTIIGDEYNWEFWGAQGDDRLIGAENDEELWGQDGVDLIKGNAGNDSLSGGNDSDTMYGDAGADSLYGGNGSDFLYGGSENDFLFGNGPFININALTGEELNEAGGDVGDSDYLEGNDGNDWISSGQYIDIILGGAGRDNIFGGAGNDVLDGGDDDDFILGDSAGNSARYIISEILELTLDLSLGDIGVYFRTFTGVDHVDVKDESLSYDDNIIGGRGNDVLIGEIGDDVIQGGEGNDWIEGDKRNDSTLYGGDEGQYTTAILNDVEITLASDDFVEFDVQWSGDDTLYGGSGEDTIFGNAGDDILYGDDGNDYLHGDDDLLLVVDHGNDILHGGGGDDLLQGYGGDDELYGDDNDDVLYGGFGDDKLFGGDGIDGLLDGAGNDYLDGGAGADQLQGEDGADTVERRINIIF